jgi:fermentation-respiration switch protein FrsA (DUF1100 family)
MNIAAKILQIRERTKRTGSFFILTNKLSESDIRFLSKFSFLFSYFCIFAATTYQIMKKKVIYSVLSTIIVLVITTIVMSFYLLNYALAPKVQKLSETYRLLYLHYPETKQWVDSLQKSNSLRDTFIRSQDGDLHHAIYAFAHKKTNKVAILVHGYQRCSVDMLMIAKIYADRNFNILLPDLHASGKSQGESIQMGWEDRKDVLEWMAVANNLFADSTGHTQMVAHGISMGAAAIMCVAGERTPPYLKCFIEDCGYTSVWDEFSGLLKDQFNLPEFPLMYTSSKLCKLKYGWDFREASPIQQVGKCHKPMMFIHGNKDTYVPFYMMSQLANAKTGTKIIYIAPHSIHAESYHDHPKEYIHKMMQFVNKYIQ